ncbi:hypothetical protein KQ51_01344 [Candidatus Izimaplasma bacterium HR1]|jgi:hypothetical protein|uniref:DUF2779 domain-containing protein n=1 Tax=Candidatus Izimoplasma sp. HR1 TaxID=1541959 RepID=UPI0004F5C173|nr:hypothetical protein KQ51_01344 [Candidatus Izimaplasma bacterium HR1]
MSSMNLTKSKFMEFIRCNRYPALNKIHKRKDLDDAEKDRFYDLIDTLENFDFDNEDFLEPDLEHLEVMMPYYNEVEVLAARKVMSEWQGETQYGTKFGTQKLFMRDHKSFNLMCYVDIYNKDKSQINIIEVKATTSNKYMSMGYRVQGDLISIFYKDDNGIIKLKEEQDPSWLDDPKYMKKRQRLLDRFTGEGVYVYDLAFQRFVIEEDIQDAKYYLGVLNHEYEFDGTYFEGEPVYTNESSCFIDLTKITKELLPIIERDIDLVIERIINDDESRVHLGKHCQLKKQRQCIYKDICYDKFPKKNSIMMFTDKHHGFKDEEGNKYDIWDLIQEGNYAMTDLSHDLMNRRNNQIQRDCAITHKPFYDFEKIRQGIEVLQYPIYHLDFESFPCPLPRFKGERAYMQSLFQFSLHIERTPGVCDKEKDHFEFLAYNHEDTREELVQKLCEYIPDDGGSVLVYNQAFEKTRIKELAIFFPEYSDKLHNINSRLFDLMHIIKNNTKMYESLGFDTDRAKAWNYYSEDLYGSFSIKKVLPIFSDLSYQDMVVGNGMAAVYAYAGFHKLNPEELKDIRTALTEYCKQDTWAMVEILDELRKI